MSDSSPEAQVLSDKMRPVWLVFISAIAGLGGTGAYATDGLSVFSKQAEQIEALKQRVDKLEAQAKVRLAADKKLLKNHRKALKLQFSQREVLREMLEARLPKNRRTAWRLRAQFWKDRELELMSQITLADE